MKQKTSFVTNSSSSSFVICIKNDLKQSELANHLLESVKQFVMEEYNKQEWIDDVENLSDEAAAKIISQSLAENILYDVKDGIEIGEWKVTGGECGNEGNSGLDLFLYECGIKDSDKIKFKTIY